MLKVFVHENHRNFVNGTRLDYVTNLKSCCRIPVIYRHQSVRLSSVQIGFVRYNLSKKFSYYCNEIIIFNDMHMPQNKKWVKETILHKAKCEKYVSKLRLKINFSKKICKMKTIWKAMNKNWIANKEFDKIVDENAIYWNLVFFLFRNNHATLFSLLMNEKRKNKYLKKEKRNWNQFTSFSIKFLKVTCLKICDIWFVFKLKTLPTP